MEKIDISLEQFKENFRSKKRFGVSYKTKINGLRPIEIFQSLTKPEDGSILLEFDKGREFKDFMSILALSPYLTLESYGMKSKLTNKKSSYIDSNPPLTILKNLLEANKCANEVLLPPFVSGAFGFMSYDAIRLFEKIPDRHPNIQNIPDLFFQFYETIINFDHSSSILTIYLFIVPDSDMNVEAAYDEIQKKLEGILSVLRTINQLPQLQPDHEVINDKALPDLDDASFRSLIMKAKDYIFAGDIFQVVLSRTFKQDFSGSILDIYRGEKILNPAPFHFLLNTKGYAFASSSPERLVSVRNRVVETMPIAGTRPRTHNDVKDSLLEQELLMDPKENAEHTMLVDLARNDLGRISEIGSVEINETSHIIKYPYIMHMVSNVRGILKKDVHPLDALVSTFPAGTVSGAPKIRAMEIIDELEISRRGLYGGVACMVDSKGNLDACIAIRMCMLSKGEAYVRAGAGIVYDSDPQKEADETRFKANGVLKAIALAEEGTYDHTNR